MAEVLYYAIPAFVLLLVMELLSFKYLRDEELVGYESRDTRTSLTMGGGNVVIRDLEAGRAGRLRGAIRADAIADAG